MELKFLKGRRILVISPESWDHIPISKHHYASTLAQFGNDVYFLNPPSHTSDITPEPELNNLSVVNYKGIPGLNYLPGIIRDFFNRILLQRILKLCGGNFDVVWTFDPFRFQNLKIFKSSAKVYHAVDIHKSSLENTLANSCDIILSVSDMILARFGNFGKPGAKINHGLAPHFLKKPVIKGSPEKNGKLRVGYVGNLDNWCLDRSTLLTIVKNHPEIDFQFIGPFKSDSDFVSSLKASPNSTLVGKVSSLELPDYLHQCDLFLMCYDGNNKEVNSNHHKIIEYLATGKPVVMNYTDEYKDKRDIVAMSDENRDLPILFARVVRKLSEYSVESLSSKRIAFAQSNLYGSQVMYIDSILMQTIPNVQAVS